MATIHAASLAQADVQAAIDSATAGDWIVIPGGTETYGTSGALLQVNKAVVLQFPGKSAATINLSAQGSTGNNGVIRIQSVAASIIGGFTAYGPASPSVNLFSVSGAVDGWKIGDVDFIVTSTGGKYLYVEGSYGVVYNFRVVGGGGSNEFLWVRGRVNSWQTPASYGTPDAVYFEDGIIEGAGYTDWNDNARVVCRYLTINGQNKIDGHGYASNSLRGCRHTEIYNCHWTAAAGPWRSVEIRGGGLIAVDNTCDYKSGVSVFQPSFELHEYGVSSNAWPNFSSRYQTPQDYPVTDQTGVGVDPKAAASEPAYLINNRAGLISHAPGIDWTLSWTRPNEIAGTTNATGYAIGATSIEIATQASTTGGGGTIRTTDYVKFAGDPNYYAVAVQKSSGAGTLVLAAPGLLQELPASTVAFESGAQVLYRQQTGNPSASYTMQDIIAADRDYYKHTAGATFNGTSGCGRGAKADMLAITPPDAKPYGFWVTDEGSWNTTKPANTSGRLYRWDGDSWEQHYEPYTYPHPFNDGVAPPVEVAPYFSVHPQSTAATVGDTVTLTVSAGGSPSPTYQWRKGGVNIGGATSSSLVLSNVQAADAASYDCVATNSEGSATSNAATLTVSEPLSGPPDNPSRRSYGRRIFAATGFGGIL